MRIVDSWLKQLHEEVGSDLFVMVDAPPCIKVHGKIKPISTDALKPEETRDVVFSLMSERQKNEFIQTNECQFAYSLDRDVRFRISAFFQQGFVGMVCRRIENRIPTFEELGCPDIMAELALQKRGILLFVGATGTGKSTTMAAMIGYLFLWLTDSVDAGLPVAILYLLPVVYIAGGMPWWILRLLGLAPPSI